MHRGPRHWQLIAALASGLGCASAPRPPEPPAGPRPESHASDPHGVAPLPQVSRDDDPARDPVAANSTANPEPSGIALPDVSTAGSKRGDRPGPGRGWSDEDLARIRHVQAVVNGAAAEFGVDPDLVNGLIWVESKFQRRARGPAGAQGYMQIMPRTAKGIARKLGERAKPHDAKWNIRAGSFALARNLERFGGDETLALAAYNRGTGTVVGWRSRGEPVPERTQAYVHRVMRAREWFVAARRTGLLAPQAAHGGEIASRGPFGPVAGW